MILQHTDSDGIGDVYLADDGVTVTVDGLPSLDSVVTIYDGQHRIAVDQDEIINVNPIPAVAAFVCNHTETGASCTLTFLDDDIDKDTVLLAHYKNPGNNKIEGTYPFVGLTAECISNPTKHIYLGLLIDGVAFSCVRFPKGTDNYTITCGGDLD